MLKRLLTAAVGVVGLLVVGLGVASATAWRADDVLVAEVAGGAHTLVTDPGVLELGGDPVTVTVTASGGAHVVLAVGRDTDVEGWVGTDAHDRVTGLASWHRLSVKPVEAAPATPDDAAPDDAAAGDAAAGDQAAAATEAAVADPTGSDLWVAQADGTGSATLVWHAQPGRWSLLAVSTGDAAPALSLAWPRTVTTPWLWPCVVLGSLLVLASAGLLLREWLRRRAGLVGPRWQEVTTGPVAVVPQPVGAQQALTRRQLREAAAGRTSSAEVGRADEPAGSTHAAASAVPVPGSGSASGGAAPSTPPAEAAGPALAATGQGLTATGPGLAATGPGLTAVTAASSRRALRTGAVPVVPTSTSGTVPDLAPAARPGGGPAAGSTTAQPAASAARRTAEGAPGTAQDTGTGAGTGTGVGAGTGAGPVPAPISWGWTPGPRPASQQRPTPPESAATPTPGPATPTPGPAGTSSTAPAEVPPAPPAAPPPSAASGRGPLPRPGTPSVPGASPGQGPAPHGRPAWASVAAPAAELRHGGPAAAPPVSTGPVAQPAPVDGSSATPVQRPAWLRAAGPQTALGAGDTAAGSRGDAWRRAWGLPATDSEGREGTEHGGSDRDVAGRDSGDGADGTTEESR